MTIRNQLSQSANLLSAVDAVRNVRAASLLLLTLLASMLLFALGGFLSVRVHGLLGMLLVLLGLGVAFYGANAVGIMSMDEARGGTSRPMLAALFSSLANGHRLILLMLLVGAVYLVGLLAMVIVLFVCKLPGLGPLLFTVVYPVCAVLAGVAIFALYAVVMPLGAPAIWSGATTMQALARLTAIARDRVVGVILSFVVLLLITGFVAMVVGGIMGAGTLVATALSAPILQAGGMNFAGFMDLFREGGGGGYVAAGALGMGVVWAIAFTLPGLVYARGCCQVYLANVDTAHAEEVEQQLRSSIDAARRKAEEIRARGEAMAAAPARPALAAEAVATACPGCGAACASGDVFCGSCGHKLA